jgi:hypothetical protein
MPIYRGGTEVEVGQLKIGSQDVKEVYLGATKIWPEAVALQPALIPTYAAFAGIVGGWRVPVANYDASFSWSVTTTAGVATINSGGLVEVTGLADSQSSTVTVTTSKSGHHNGSSSTSGQANGYEPPPPPEDLNFDNPSNGGYTGGGTYIVYSAMGSGVGNAADCSGTAVIGWDVKHASDMVVELVETKTVPCYFTDSNGGVQIEISGSPSTSLDTCHLEGSTGGRSLRKRVVEATVTNPNGSISTFSSRTNWSMGTLTSCE